MGVAVEYPQLIVLSFNECVLAVLVLSLLTLGIFLFLRGVFLLPGFL